MATTNVGNVGSYLYDAYAKTSANREDLADWIANIDPYDTPLLNTLGRTKANSAYHEWLTDTLDSVPSRGVTEGKDWAAPTLTGPSRVVNQCEIFLQDVAVTETQREINAAGFADAYQYQLEKATKNIMRSIESALMNDGTPTTGTSATNAGRVMKSLEEFITTNTTSSTSYTGLGVAPTTTAVAGTIAEKNVNDLLQTVWTAGGMTDLIVCGAPYKRQISNFTGNGNNTRYVQADTRTLIVPVDVYHSEFGVIPIQLNRWSPVSTNTATSTATATAAGINDVTGRIWLLERARVRTAWLRPLSHRLMGTRGDSTVGQVVAELTLEVGNEKALGKMTGVSNKSAVT